MANDRRDVEFLTSFEGLRGFAAFGVFIYHFHHVSAFDGLTKFAPGFFELGWLFVDLFFVLSGWVMAHVYFDRLAQRNLGDVSQFFVARIARIYPLHLVVLLSWIAFSIFVIGSQTDHFTFRNLLGQLTLTFTWGPLTTAGFVAPAWSISAEFFAYLLFPMIVFLTRSANTVRGLILGAFGMLAYIKIHTTFGSVHSLDAPLPLRALAGFLIGIGMWMLSISNPQTDNVRGWKTEALAIAIFVGAAFADNAQLGFLLSGVVLICSVSGGSGPIARFLQTRPFQFLGRLSFSVYLWHWFVIAWLQRYQETLPIQEAAILMSLCVVFILLWSDISVRFVETPARKAVRKRYAKSTSALGGIGRFPSWKVQ